jgi:hypothetical protein
MSGSETTWGVAVYLHGASLVPDTVTAILGVSPTRSWNRGQQHKTASGHVITRKLGLWKLDGSHAPGHLEQKVESLVGRIAVEGNLLGSVPGLESAKLAVFWARSADDRSPSELWLSPVLMGRMSSLGLTFGIELFLEEDEDDGGVP